LRKLVPALLFVLTGARGKPTAPPRTATRKDQNSIELDFFLSDQSFDPDASRALSVTATLEGRPFGLSVQLGPRCKSGPGYIDMSTFECAARPRSMDASIEFIRRDAQRRNPDGGPSFTDQVRPARI